MHEESLFDKVRQLPLNDTQTVQQHQEDKDRRDETHDEIKQPIDRI
jgi:hypothetical protein